MIDKEHNCVHDKAIAKIVHKESTTTGRGCNKDHAWLSKKKKMMISWILGYLTKLIITGYDNSNIQDNLLLENTKTKCSRDPRRLWFSPQSRKLMKTTSATLSSLRSIPNTTLLLLVVTWIGIIYHCKALD